LPTIELQKAPEKNSETEARRRDRPTASLTSNLLEIVMLAFLFRQISRWFEHAEQHRNDEYLAGARDLAELERRMRSLERA
jgi:ribosomal protein S15P/S13E